ncbi:4-diphosphocytidyl-2-C-methyl-D-erythritol kinase [Vibrio astriarenae]|nr:4-diphosphocytidyl-2-C-methyl-D-erythritol kinase [Vibrio sp. C7]
MTHPFTWPSPAKLNLFLYINNQRLMAIMSCKLYFSLSTLAMSYT